MIARECPEQDQAWRRHAAPGDNYRMPVPSRRLKELIEGTADHHASQHWPALEEVTISWRGSYGYLTGYDSYTTAVLLDGSFTGHPNQALDTACTLYLADTSDHTP